MDKGNKWFDFLMNLAGVVLGILLTFGVNSLYQQREENKKVQEMLILVRNELQTNKDWFKSQESYMKKDSYVYRKILEAENDWASFPEDTLYYYFNRAMSLSYNQLTTSAWHIFQNSEIIQKMSDKELIITLTDCYFWIDKVQDIIMTEYWDNKKIAIVPEVDPYKYFNAVMKKKEAVFFYTIMTSEGAGVSSLFPTIDAIIDYTVMLLDKHGDYKFDTDEREKEFEAYLQSRQDSVNIKNDTISK